MKRLRPTLTSVSQQRRAINELEINIQVPNQSSSNKKVLIITPNQILIEKINYFYFLANEIFIGNYKNKNYN